MTDFLLFVVLQDLVGLNYVAAALALLSTNLVTCLAYRHLVFIGRDKCVRMESTP